MASLPLKTKPLELYVQPWTGSQECLVGGVYVRNRSILLGKFQNVHPQLLPGCTGSEDPEQGLGLCILALIGGVFNVAYPFTLL